MKARVIEIYPDAERPGWSLFIEDDTGTPIDYTDAASFAVKVRVGGSTFAIDGEVTAGMDPTSDNDLPTDLPSLLFEPAAGALASLPSGPAPARVIVYVGTGDVVARHDFPAKVVP